MLLLPVETPAHATREAWLDGLRGYAACVVVTFHLTVGVVNFPYESYWANPPDRRHVIQLPPFHLLVAGQAMVRLFFVISGYSISLGIPRPYGNDSYGADLLPLYRKLTSSALRRGFRLYIPVVVWSVISHILWYVDLYAYPVLDGMCPQAEPWSSVWPHIQCLAIYLLDVGNCIDVQLSVLNPGLNISMWTIPVEFRGSMVIYLVLLALATVTNPRTRISIIAGLTAFHCWHGTLDLFPFFCGFLMAEGRLLHRASYTASILPNERMERHSHERRRRMPQVTAISLAGLLIAIYLLSLPADSKELFAPDWWFQLYFQPPRWQDVEVYQHSCYTIGATLCIAALHGLPLARAAMETRPFKFLGRISFSLYIVHCTVILVLRAPLLRTGHWLWSWTEYLYIPQDSTGIASLAWAWLFTSAVMGAILLFLAGQMTVLLDDKVVSFAANVERLLSLV